MEILPQRSDTLDKQELNLKSDRKEKNSQELNLMVNVIFRGAPKTV